MFRHSLVFGLAIIALTAEAKWPEGAEPFARAVLRPQGEAQVSGTIDLAKLKDDLLVRAYLKGTPKGSHALRVLEKKDCETSGKGVLFTPPGLARGERSPGDLGNLSVNEATDAATELKAEAPKGFKKWNAIVGKTLVLFERPGSLAGKPETDLGSALACGVIESTASPSE